MTHRRRTQHLRFLTAAIVVATLAAVPISSSSANPSLGQLNSELSQNQAHQQSLSSSIAGLSHLISSLDTQIALVQSREAAVRAALARDQTALIAARQALVHEQQVVAMLRARLARARMLLARQLLSSYENDKPDLVSVVLESHGFSDLLDKLAFLKDAEQQQQSIISVTRAAKAQADAAAKRLAALEANDQRITEDTLIQARALAGMDALLQGKQAALQQARAAQSAALSAARARGSQLQSEIAKIQAQQAAAAAAAAQAGASFSAGPALGASGGWAIPYAIVLCESGGQNLPPNSAGASGYYQIIPSTWAGEGGTGPAAYLAPKSEQDAIAAKLWNGGAGASNWVCAGIVGIH